MHKTLNDFYEQAVEDSNRKFDTGCYMDEMYFNAGNLGVHPSLDDMFRGFSQHPLPLTRHAYNRLHTRMFGAADGWKLSYDNLKHRPGFDDVWNDVLSDPSMNSNKKGRKSMLLRGIGTDKGDQWRFVASNVYSPYDNHEVLEDVIHCLSETGKQIGYNGGLPHDIVRGSWMDNDGHYIKVTIPILGNDEHYALGFMVRGSEIGRSSQYIYPMVQDGRCQNSFVMAYSRQELAEMGIAYKIVHSYNTRADYRYNICNVLTKYALKQSAELVEAMAEAATKELFDSTNVLAKMLKAKLGKEREDVVYTAIAGMNGQPTAMGIADGITYVAHACPEMSNEDRMELEALGGMAVRIAGQTDMEGENLANAFFRIAGKVLVNEE